MSWEIISETPWWHFVIGICFIRLGFLATKPYQVTFNILVIMPIVGIILSCAAMYLGITMTPYLFALWISAMLSGTVLGWLHYRILNIKANKDKRILHMPGTWLLLIFIMGIGLAKYYYGSRFLITPEKLLQPEYAPIILGLYGFFTGLFIGRMTYAYRCLKMGPYTA